MATVIDVESTVQGKILGCKQALGG